MALSKRYSWYIEGNTIAIVEPDTSSDSDWQAISTTGKTFKIVAGLNATGFDSILTDDDKTYNIPSRFRRSIADLAISKGYEVPPNVNLDMAGHFYNKYKTKLKDMKKVARGQYQSKGIISGWYY